MTRLWLAQTDAANELLAANPFALLTGMLLDQQVPMERAFTGPHLLAERLGDPHSLDPCRLSALDVADLEAAAVGPPAIHRFPTSMAERIRGLAEVVCRDYAGDAARIWTGAADGADCLRRLAALPGFGDQKSRIFLALILKRGLLPHNFPGARAASAPYGEPGTFMSIADVTGPDSLLRVREWKQAQKAAARGSTSTTAGR